MWELLSDINPLTTKLSIWYNRELSDIFPIFDMVVKNEKSGISSLYLA